MIRLIQKKLIIPRGDTGTFTIPALSSEGTAVFTIFSDITKTKILSKQVEVSGDTFTISFTHSETVNLPAGRYLWDIKFYKNPLIVDNILIDGEEIDSYYAAFRLPECEIKETGDNYLTIEGAMLEPTQIDLITAAMNEIQADKEAAVSSATAAAASATAAANSASAALSSQQAAAASLSATLLSEQNALGSATAAAASASAAAASAVLAQQTAQAIHEEIPTKVSDLLDDSGHYTKPVTGIPAADLEETYVKSTDYATDSIGGTVKVDSSLGIAFNNVHVLQISPASTNDIKSGQSVRKPIVPYTQHRTVFYGLAKAAGDTSQSQSDNEVGIYTTTAQTAIQQMLGVPSVSAIPTAVSQLTNDTGYLTEHQDISGKANSADLATVATSGSYNDLEDKPTIPDIQIAGTSIVENGVANIPIATGIQYGVMKIGSGLTLVNDIVKVTQASSSRIKAGIDEYSFIPIKSQHTATFYGLAKAAGDTSQASSSNAVGTYTTTAQAAIQSMLGVPSTTAVTDAIAAAIGNINSFDMAVVQELPSQDISTHTIYLVPKTGETNDVYDEYVYINSNWEMVGNTQIDLSNYVQKTDYASTTAAGIVGIMDDGAYGIHINNNNHKLRISSATTAGMKNGNEAYRPIVANIQHIATFYGLAKAAGDTTQSQSDNAVGTYTTTAQAAIRSMIGAAASADIPDTSIYATKADTVLETSLSRGRKENTTIGTGSFAFGQNVEASGTLSHAEGNNTIASGLGSHAEGQNTTASAITAHTEGRYTTAAAAGSHAEGYYTIANGQYSHVSGTYNVEDSYDNWPLWQGGISYNIGDRVKINISTSVSDYYAGYICIEANNDIEFIQSKWESRDKKMNYVEIIGNGTSANGRSNARALDWNGNEYLAGDIYVGVNVDSSSGTKVATIAELATKLDAAEAGLKVVRLI